MLLTQILVSFFVLVNIWRIARQARVQKMSLGNVIAWSLLWLVVLVVFWAPDSTGYLAQALGITRGADLMIYSSVLLIFFLLFKIFVRLNKIEESITKLVRQRAIDQNKEDEQR